MSEILTYQYQNPRELVSDGFSVEYAPQVMDQELRADIISYLAEYRFKVKKYDYDLEFSYTDDEGFRLRDPHRHEAMGVKAERSVRERIMRGESINRESAEAIGISFLEEQLQTAENDDSVVWGSPPGSAEEGFNERYGFFFLGQVKRTLENKKRIKMSAIRVEKPTIDAYNIAFGQLTGIDVNYKTPEDFLRFPVVFSGQYPKGYVEHILASNFPFGMDEDQQQVFDQAMLKMQNRIDEFIAMVKYGTREEKRRAFFAIENYSLALKKELESGIGTVYKPEDKFEDFVRTYGFESPDVKGNCPITSSNPLSLGFEALNKALEFEDAFAECKICKQTGVDNHYHCPGCNTKFASEKSLSPRERTKECSCGFKFNCN